ncbi:MAG: UDP binding domain-containing protein, partial [Blastocatellia bacterium]
ELLDKKVSVIAFDPLANGRASRALDGKARIAATPQECITQSDVIVLATPWKEFLAIPAESWSRAETPRIVVDCWRALKYLKELPGIRYISLGIGELVAPVSMARAL